MEGVGEFGQQMPAGAAPDADPTVFRVVDIFQGQRWGITELTDHLAALPPEVTVIDLRGLSQGIYCTRLLGDHNRRLVEACLNRPSLTRLRPGLLEARDLFGMHDGVREGVEALLHGRPVDEPYATFFRTTVDFAAFRLTPTSYLEVQRVVEACPQLRNLDLREVKFNPGNWEEKLELLTHPQLTTVTLPRGYLPGEVHIHTPILQSRTPEMREDLIAAKRARRGVHTDCASEEALARVAAYPNLQRLEVNKPLGMFGDQARPVAPALLEQWIEQGKRVARNGGSAQISLPESSVIGFLKNGGDATDVASFFRRLRLQEPALRETALEIIAANTPFLKAVEGLTAADGEIATALGNCPTLRSLRITIEEGEECPDLSPFRGHQFDRLVIDGKVDKATFGGLVGARIETLYISPKISKAALEVVVTQVKPKWITFLRKRPSPSRRATITDARYNVQAVKTLPGRMSDNNNHALIF